MLILRLVVGVGGDDDDVRHIGRGSSGMTVAQQVLHQKQRADCEVQHDSGAETEVLVCGLIFH